MYNFNFILHKKLYVFYHFIHKKIDNIFIT